MRRAWEDPLPRFHSRDPAMLEDPYSVYEGLRQAGPLCRGGPGQWVVTRYAEVAALLKDRRLGAEYPEEYHRLSVGDGPAVSFFQRIILDRDPPDHTRLRRLLGAAFSPSLVRRLADHIGDLVDRLLAPALDRGSFDAVSDLAFPLPVLVVCELIGIPTADRDSIRPRVTDLAKGFALVVPEHERPAAHEAVVWLREYIGDLVERKRVAPDDDLLSRMIAARDEGGQLTHDEIVDNAVFLFFAGFETTMNLIATGCHALLAYPDQLARLRADPSLVPAAVEEFLRYDAPIQAAARLVREPIEVGGRTIRAGRLLILLLGSANHDERQFAEPARLDVGRTPNPHVSFGGGVHHCLGAALARIEGQVAFSHLLKRFSVLEPAGEPVRRPSTTFRSFTTVPISVRAA
jgi:cytochrome P450